MAQNDSAGLVKVQQVLDAPNTEQTNNKIDRAIWENLKGKDLANSVTAAYLEIVRWRRNLSNLPTGKAGENFIDEVANLYRHVNDGIAFESIALTLPAIIFPLLLLYIKDKGLCTILGKTNCHVEGW